MTVLGLALVLTACSSGSEPKKTRAVESPSPSASAVSSTPPPPPEPSRLSGRMGKPNGPVYAVKVDNTGHAHPQVGLSKADVVYVEQVEGGVTRLAAIYSSEYPKFVGPSWPPSAARSVEPSIDTSQRFWAGDQTAVTRALG